MNFLCGVACADDASPTDPSRQGLLGHTKSLSSAAVSVPHGSTEVVR